MGSIDSIKETIRTNCCFSFKIKKKYYYNTDDKPKRQHLMYTAAIRSETDTQNRKNELETKQ